MEKKIALVTTSLLLCGNLLSCTTTLKESEIIEQRPQPIQPIEESEGIKLSNHYYDEIKKVQAYEEIVRLGGDFTETQEVNINETYKLYDNILSDVWKEIESRYEGEEYRDILEKQVRWENNRAEELRKYKIECGEEEMSQMMINHYLGATTCDRINYLLIHYLDFR